jgi:Arc/MetJ-type ribon-helix-helix transcriptional regulator
MRYKVIGAKIPEKVDYQIDEVVSAGFYLNRAELLRDALRRLLLELEVEKCA